jgi:23S rRNA (cytidine2498-2'-O)-methyltransferase
MCRPDFIFLTCQVGVEPAVKADLVRRLPGSRFCFSRPGFLTFKLPEQHGLTDNLRLPSVFARCGGFSLGQIRVDSTERLAKAVWDRVGDLPVQHLHVFERDVRRPGEKGYEPTISALACDTHRSLRRADPQARRRNRLARNPVAPARRGRLVLDCVRVDPERWWLGWHRADLEESRWPGGMFPLELPADAVSRAWLKMEEALRWSRLPVRRGARVAEIGCAPGGAAQALLGRGCEVLGVDPADVHPRVRDHPNFRHVRGRAREIRRREFRKVRWLVVDINAAPPVTLDVVEDIVSHRQVQVRGLLLTLKLADWTLADQLAEWGVRIRGWGFNIVRARQLVHNRQEICVAALQKPFRR